MKIYSVNNIAEILDVTPRRVRQLKEDGVICEKTKGYYELLPTLHKYIHYLRQQAGETEVSADLSTERAKLTRVRREKAEIDLQLKRNEVHEAKAIEYLMTNMLLAFKSKLNALPNKLLPLIVGAVDDKAKIIKILNDGIYEALTELSEYDPAEFADLREEEE